MILQGQSATGAAPFRYALRVRRRAAAVLRAERVGLYALAAHADRALRTLAARRCAAEAYALAQRLRSGRALDVLASRPTWTRLAIDQFAYSFGGRRAVVTMPPSATAQQLASMIARVEIRVLLGDADQQLIAHLQTFAARELERLFSSN